MVEVKTNGTLEGTHIYINKIDITEKVPVQYMRIYKKFKASVKVEIGVFDRFDLLSDFKLTEDYVKIKFLEKPF